MFESSMDKDIAPHPLLLENSVSSGALVPLLDNEWTLDIFDDRTLVNDNEKETEALIDDGPPVNDHEDIFDVRYEIAGLEYQEPQPVQGCSIFAEDAYGSVCYSKHRYDHKSFTSWFNAVISDIEGVYNLLKADWPIYEELSHINPDLIKPLIGTWGEIDRGFAYVRSACRDVFERADTIYENRDIVEAIHLARAHQGPLPFVHPLFLTHLNPIVLKAAMDENDRLVPTDEPGTESRRLVNIIDSYKRKLTVYDRELREKAIPRAFACFFRNRPIPVDLQHIRVDLFELMTEPNMMRDLKIGHLRRKNMNLLAKSVRDLVIAGYKAMLALEDQTHTMMDLLQLHYWPYMATGIAPTITLACDRNIFPRLVYLVASDHEPNKQSLLVNGPYIMACVHYLNPAPPPFYLRQADFAI